MGRRLSCCARGAPGFELESVALAKRVVAAAVGKKSAAVAVQRGYRPGVEHAAGFEGTLVVLSVVGWDPDRTEKGYGSGP
jgi:hypothetical protein